ncbi:uncharacterized protein EV420DRAFT_622419 [Desarmillaria tabescens]|uniref:Uncharacterized protein n=1 Tax=Armillaria tabescens TaxID=1929756 RepID=A0AA39K8F3_ARMTA|nr:uncharacterized protein EV420DRAFT_622419 [Desarmillaria tabescens]KAK0454138.1 hypothetical protein EV420DRAFT_622419 [Desarmillaria tabescens]
MLATLTSKQLVLFKMLSYLALQRCYICDYPCITRCGAMPGSLGHDPIMVIVIRVSCRRTTAITRRQAHKGDRDIMATIIPRCPCSLFVFVDNGRRYFIRDASWKASYNLLSSWLPIPYIDLCKCTISDWLPFLSAVYSNDNQSYLSRVPGRRRNRDYRHVRFSVPPDIQYIDELNQPPPYSARPMSQAFSPDPRPFKPTRSKHSSAHQRQRPKATGTCTEPTDASRTLLIDHVGV